MKDLVVLDDKAIQSIAQNPAAIAALPCLKGPGDQIKSLQEGGPNCPRCSHKRKAAQKNALAAARQCIKSARGESLAKLKRAIGAKKLRIVARNNKGHWVKYTF